MEAGRIRALIIEDNQDITANLYAFLEPLGYELDCSANGHIGLEMAVAGTFDVIVLDIMLPGMDGLAVCRALREDHTDPTPILMLTARDTVADRVTGLDCGADDYLVKPFSMKELDARLGSSFWRHCCGPLQPSSPERNLNKPSGGILRRTAMPYVPISMNCGKSWINRLPVRSLRLSLM